ncbi:hypothetical protein EG68_08443 [Paragonimus skrjabini miyazakii]|uniref:Uncharacterized protein n=1 Tax=Paragonimus skrjabini miyazakii TaxID=59628 RepID=A0A8S9YNY0_9TREM|nr:hypothetical protein EG68_08443 [Paragonimus skrjabini miyazakii]
MLPSSILLVSIYFQLVVGVTMEEGLKNPERYIRFDTDPNYIWAHALKACAMTFGSLTFFHLLVHLVQFLTGGRRRHGKKP